MKHGAILVLLLAAFTIFSEIRIDAKVPDRVGTRLTNLKLKTLSGSKVKILDMIKEKIAVIVFTTTWCSDCKKLARVLENIIPRYRKKGVEFYFIYVGQDQKIVTQNNKKTNKDNLPVILLDEKRKAALKWQLTRIPNLVMVGMGGIVRYEGLLLDEKKISIEIEKVIKCGGYGSGRSNLDSFPGLSSRLRREPCLFPTIEAAGRRNIERIAKNGL